LKQYKVEAGAEDIKIFQDKETLSGGVLERAFCSNCGSNLFNRNTTNPQMSGNIVVCAGSLDDSYKDFNPQSELFADKRHAWVPEVKKKKKTGEAKI